MKNIGNAGHVTEHLKVRRRYMRIKPVNPIAKDLRQPKYKPRVVLDKKQKKKDKQEIKESYEEIQLKANNERE